MMRQKLMVFFREVAVYFLVAILGAIAAASVFVFLIVWGIRQRGIEIIGKRDINEGWYLLISALLFIIIFALGVIYSKKLLLSISTSIIIVLLTSGYVLVSAYMQQKDVKNALKERKIKGFPTTLEELFPDASTQEQCRMWLKSVRLEHTQDEVFLGRIINNFYSETLKPLENGKNLDEAVSKADPTSKPEWKKIIAYNQAGIEAMKKCPYFQWFSANNYEQSYQMELFIKGELDLQYWARSMVGQALILAKNGQVEEATMLLYTLHDAIDKFYIPNQDLSASLIAMAMDNIAATGYIRIQVLSRQPISEEDINRIASFSKTKIAWAKSIVNVASYECFRDLEDCQEGVLHPIFNKYLSLHFPGDSLPIITGQIVYNSKIVRCAVMNSETEKYLTDIEKSSEWMRAVPDFSNDSYAWHEAHSILLKESSVYMSPYVRIVRNCASWRIVLALDFIIRYYKDKGMLPDGIEAGNKKWPLDPFDEKPLRYKKTGEHSFIIYSVGPDEEDNKGEKLHVWGPICANCIKEEKPEDIGYHIVLQ